MNWRFGRRARLARRVARSLVRPTADYEFLDPAAGITAAPPSPVALWLGAAICALVASGLAAAWFGRVDIYAQARGRIQPAGRSKVIQPPDQGEIDRIFVKNGDEVRAGQTLLELDAGGADADRNALADQNEALAGEIARRRAAIQAARRGDRGDRPIDFPKGLPQYVLDQENAVMTADLAHLRTTVLTDRARLLENTAQQQSLSMSISAHKAVVDTLHQRLQVRQELVDEGWETKTNSLDAAADLQKEIVTLRTQEGQLAAANAEAVTLREQVDDAISHFIDDNSQGIETAGNKLEQGREELAKAEESVNRKRLTAPISGTIQELAVTTLGQVVESGQQLMTIVPNRASLEVQALVPDRDIGFVRAGDHAVVKVDAFPYSRYGTISGRIVNIAREAVTVHDAMSGTGTQNAPVKAEEDSTSPTQRVDNLVYPVRLILDSDSVHVDGHIRHLQPGMTVSVDILTGKRRLLDYLLAPLIETASGAGHER